VEGAVETFEKSRDLAPNGVVGPAVWHALYAALAPKASGPVLQMGDTGAEVKVLETDLQHLGLYHGYIDGIFGPHVRGAVKVFEREHGLPATGVVNAAVWNALTAAQHAAPVSHVTTSPDAPLRVGDQGAAVATVQTLLIRLGAHLGANGNFGPETLAAVLVFQRMHGLPATGAVNAATLAALRAAVTEEAQGTLLRMGDQGPAVAILQRELTAAGFSTLGVDGIFGPDTQAAVIAFQRAQGLPATGVAGRLVEEALMRTLQVNRGMTVPGALAAAIVGYAQQFVGDPYVWGGESPTTGFDCSGLVQYIFRHFGIALPRTSYAQFDVGQRIPVADLEPGDLLFFATNGPGASHVGLYLGGGSFISAEDPALGVRIQPLNSYWLSVLVGATIPPGL
jgi:peptidoglycan hydrolase-like protein with peptidoglycan-binding domain